MGQSFVYEPTSLVPENMRPLTLRFGSSFVGAGVAEGSQKLAKNFHFLPGGIKKKSEKKVDALILNRF